MFLYCLSYFNHILQHSGLLSSCGKTKLMPAAATTAASLSPGYLCLSWIISHGMTLAVSKNNNQSVYLMCMVCVYAARQPFVTSTLPGGVLYVFCILTMWVLSAESVLCQSKDRYGITDSGLQQWKMGRHCIAKRKVNIWIYFQKQ